MPNVLHALVVAGVYLLHSCFGLPMHITRVAICFGDMTVFCHIGVTVVAIIHAIIVMLVS